MASKAYKPDIEPHPLITTDHAAMTPLDASAEATAPAPIRQKIVIKPLDADADETVDVKPPAVDIPEAEAMTPAADDDAGAAAEATPAAETAEQAPQADSDAPPNPEDIAKAADNEAAQMEADARAQDELDTLVAAKTYFLPINSVEHRRSRRVFIFGTILIIVLALAWLDVAMDAGFVTLPGVKPLIHLFRT